MTKYWLISLFVLLFLITAATLLYLRRKKARPAPWGYDSRPVDRHQAQLAVFLQRKGGAWRSYLAAERRSKLLRDLTDKLRTNYLRPGGIRSQCLTFLQLMKDETSLADLQTIRERLINSCLYPLHLSVQSFMELFEQAEGLSFSIRDEDIFQHLGIHPVDDSLPEPILSAAIERNLALMAQEIPLTMDEKPYAKLLSALAEALDSEEIRALICSQYDDLLSCRQMLALVQHDIEQLITHHTTGRALDKEDA